MSELLTCPEMPGTAAAGPCQATTEFGYRACESAPGVLIEWGCVHEHTGSALICAAHWKVIQGISSWCCDRCRPHGHHCPIIIREVPRA